MRKPLRTSEAARYSLRTTLARFGSLRTVLIATFSGGVAMSYSSEQNLTRRATTTKSRKMLLALLYPSLYDRAPGVFLHAEALSSRHDESLPTRSIYIIVAAITNNTETVGSSEVSDIS